MHSYLHGFVAWHILPFEWNFKNHVAQKYLVPFFSRGKKMPYLFPEKNKKKRRSRKNWLHVDHSSRELIQVWPSLIQVWPSAIKSRSQMFFLVSLWYLSAGSISTEKKKKKTTNQYLYSYLETTTALSPCRRNYCCIQNRVKLFAKSPNLLWI